MERWCNLVQMRLRSWMRRNRVETELDQELRYHLERQAEENLAAGMPVGEARLAALRMFGGEHFLIEE